MFDCSFVGLLRLLDFFVQCIRQPQWTPAKLSGVGALQIRFVSLCAIVIVIIIDVITCWPTSPYTHSHSLGWLGKWGLRTASMQRTFILNSSAKIQNILCVGEITIEISPSGWRENIVPYSQKVVLLIVEEFVTANYVSTRPFDWLTIWSGISSTNKNQL